MLRLWGFVSGGPVLDAQPASQAQPEVLKPASPLSPVREVEVAGLVHCPIRDLDACFRTLQIFVESGLPGVAASIASDYEARIVAARDVAEAEHIAAVPERIASNDAADAGGGPVTTEKAVDASSFGENTNFAVYDVDDDGDVDVDVSADINSDADAELGPGTTLVSDSEYTSSSADVDAGGRSNSESAETSRTSALSGPPVVSPSLSVPSQPEIPPPPAPFQPPEDRVVDALHVLAHLMVLADKEGQAAWDRFMEYNAMRLLVRCLVQTAPLPPLPPQSPSRPSDQNLASMPDIIGQYDDGSAASCGDAAATGGPRISDVDVAQVPLRISSRRDALSQSPSHLLIDRDMAVTIQSQVLRTLSILVQSVSRRESLYFMFASNHINDLLSFEYEFSNEELILYFMSAVKSIASKLDGDLVQFFFDARSASFPLYTATTRFFAHPEGMVRIAVRNLTLSLYSLSSPPVLEFLCSDPTGYLTNSVERLRQMCGEVSRCLEFILDDGRELRRTVSRRVGQFRGQQVRMQHLIAELAEIDNMFEYLNEIAGVQDDGLSRLILRLIGSKLIGPFFRPISSQAAPAAVALRRKEWSIRQKSARTDSKDDISCPALHVLDATARVMVLTYLINLVTNEQLGETLIVELTRPSHRFERRTVMHGLKAMVSDLSGTERTTHVALCALEAFVRADFVSPQVLFDLGLSFEVDDDSSSETRSLEVDPASARSSKSAASDVGDSLVLNLDDFNAPLTPISSCPATPRSSRGFFGGAAENQAQGSTDISFSDSLAVPQASPRTPPSPHNLDDVDDGEGILTLFRKGEASLREMLSSILLVIRAREVRSVRVTQAVVRIISAVGLRTDNWRLSLDVTKIALDEMAASIADFLANSRTTIVAIESTFDNFLAASRKDSPARLPVPELWALFQLEVLPKLASDLPIGAGRRRRSGSSGNAVVPPVEREDADSYFILLHAYERIAVEVVCAYRAATGAVVQTVRPLHDEVAETLWEEDSSSTYLDKRQALARIALQTEAASLHSRLGQ
jgi:Uncharacterised conserved protein